MNHINEQEAYKRAKKRVKEIKGFYINLLCYCIVVPGLIITNVIFTPEFHWFWFSLLGWGTGLLIHGLNAFNVMPFLGAGWEERKMKEYMDKEEEVSTNAKKDGLWE